MVLAFLGLKIVGYIEPGRDDRAEDPGPLDSGRLDPSLLSNIPVGSIKVEVIGLK